MPLASVWLGTILFTEQHTVWPLEAFYAHEDTMASKRYAAPAPRTAKPRPGQPAGNRSSGGPGGPAPHGLRGGRRPVGTPRVPPLRRGSPKALCRPDRPATLCPRSRRTERRQPSASEATYGRTPRYPPRAHQHPSYRASLDTRERAGSSLKRVRAVPLALTSVAAPIQERSAAITARHSVECRSSPGRIDVLARSACPAAARAGGPEARRRPHLPGALAPAARNAASRSAKHSTPPPPGGPPPLQGPRVASSATVWRAGSIALPPRSGIVALHATKQSPQGRMAPS